MIWLCLACTLLPPQPGVGIADDQTQIEGQWRMESVQEGGVAVDLATAPDTWTITNGVMTIGRNGMLGTTDLRITLNQRTSPKQFDVVYVGEDAGVKARYQGGVHGIYKLDGLRFTRCFVYGNLPRPTSFVPPPGTRVRLHILKRPEKEKPPLPK
ncbi:MAG: TIGR03067 domain-containing protein [Planctomycetia bacterium]|nr:TIGR03067 domain-containing protein [Planctomycetia bacterium]